jgi:hypothetical protein
VSLTPSRPLPERPSLEQLRKQAREHLDTLRAPDPTVKLVAAQHASAREVRLRELAEARTPRRVGSGDTPQPINSRWRAATSLMSHDRTDLSRDYPCAGESFIRFVMDRGAPKVGTIPSRWQR